MKSYYSRPLVLGAFLIAVLGLPFSASAEEKYYLSLGDSLAVGFQPPPVSWNHGYADQLQAMIPDLTLKKLGCYTDESTSAMINGGSCSYPHGTQLAEAVAFLQAHKNSVAFITIDIGANDVLNCFAIPIDMSCLANGLTVIKQNLPTILTALREAAGKDVPIVGMNYYDPYLAYWLFQGKGGVVTDSLKATLMFNDTLEMVYKAALPVPDVQGAFSTTNFTPKVQTDFGTIPLNVALICQWTWMCPVSGIDSHTHPNTKGYGIIAGAFYQVLPYQGLPPSVLPWVRHSGS